MITRSEIDLKAQEFGIHTSHVQRDYVFGWLIFGIYTQTGFKDTLILKGGNALRKAYFPATRFSEDLDFTTQSAVNGEALIEALNNVCQYIQDRTGVVFDRERNQIADEHPIAGQKKVYKARLYFKDFYANVDHITLRISVDVTEYDRIYLPVQSRYLIHPYSDADQCATQVPCIKLEEALADKLKCLLQRRYSLDLFDLVYSIFVNNEIAVDKREIVSTLLKKTIFTPSPVVVKNLLLELPFDFFREFWDKYVICPLQSRIQFDAAVNRFREGLQELFQPFSYGSHLSIAYFPSTLRNPILKAGSELTLLKVVYNGVSRVVEPYSLVYKTRSDGIGQEYLYVYDRTGGIGSAPGIKSLVNYHFSSIENTSEKFDPRWEVELAKAGEFGTRSFFGNPFVRQEKSQSRRTPTRSFGPTYVIQCSYCGKKFKRSKYSTRLNEHKDRYGNKCYGRVGFQVS